MALPWGQNHVAQMAAQKAAAQAAQQGLAQQFNQSNLANQVNNSAMTQLNYMRQMQALQQYQAAIGKDEPPAPRKPLEISTRFGEIIAFRFWRLHRGYLKSASTDYLWMPRAIATLKEGTKLEDYGSTGIHAFKDQGRMILQSYDGEMVFGTIKLWGDVVEYEHGYHAEFASIVSLDHADLPSQKAHERTVMEDLRARYFLPSSAEGAATP